MGLASVVVWWKRTGEMVRTVFAFPHLKIEIRGTRRFGGLRRTGKGKDNGNSKGNRIIG
jgi:hypothetical protein